MAERPFEPVPNTPLVADPTSDAIWKRWLQGLQRFMGAAVRGPGTSTDNAVARWDGTDGQFLNNSGVIIDDSNNVTGVASLTASNITDSALTAGRFVLSGTAGILASSAAYTYSESASTLNTELTGSFTSSNLLTIRNTHASGIASLNIVTGGSGQAYAAIISGSGDAAIRFSNNAGVTTHWGIGADASDSNAFVIGTSATLGTNTRVKISSAGIQTNSNKIYPGTDAAATQSASGIYAGTGAPNNANGADGDFYFRSDGGVLTTIYQRRAGAWVGLV